MGSLEAHEIAGIFPLLKEADLGTLAADIKTNGLQDAIVLYQGKILDGRNRYAACRIAGIEPRFEEYAGNDPVAFVVSLNLHRRHLTESQRGMVAAKVANLTRRDSALARHDATANLQLQTRADAAKLLNVSERTVNTAKKVEREGSPELVDAVQSGRVSVSAAADVASLPKPEQAEIVAKGEREILQKAKEIRSKKAEENREKRESEKIDALRIPPPKGLYRTIVIDPPWDMEKVERDHRPNQVGFDYPTMTYDELAKFSIPAHDEAHLYCWTTQKHLPATFDLLKSWGFRYIFTMTWHKPGGFQPFGLPQYNAEFVVFGRKGALPFLDTKAFPVCFNAPRREHSRKPDEFYDLVRRVSPGPQIDIFSREPRAGFDQFGNDTERFAS